MDRGLVSTDNVSILGDGTPNDPLTINPAKILAPGVNTEVLFNDAGLIAGDVNFTWDKTSNLLISKGTLSATALTGADFVFLQAGIIAGNRVAMGGPGSFLGDRIDILANDSAASLVNIFARGACFVSGSTLTMMFASATQINITATTMGFFNAAGVTKPVVAGAKLPGDVVLASLLAALVALGLITDTST
jgi:hypothetical protein